MRLEFDNEAHCAEFVRLNEQWIAEHFSIEDAARRLAANPARIITDGGHIVSLVEDGRVVGVCALFKDGERCYQLARMAVEPGQRGKGCGDALVTAALSLARERGASRVYLLSNTILAPAIALYRKHGFITLSEGRHPVLARCNIVMERQL
jgi:putative acetyltransferase